MKQRLTSITIDEGIIEFLDKKVEHEKAKGYGASRSAMIETAIKEFLFRRYGLQFTTRKRK